MKDAPDLLRIEPIQKSHNPESFDCGEKSLNEYLSRYAYKNHQNNISRTFVLVDSKDIVQGYYSICTASIDFEELPEETAKRLPKYPVPCVRLARLAVSNSMKGDGVGARLLIDALQRINRASAEMGIKFVIVDALDKQAASFYEHYGFIALPGQDMKLFLPAETINQLF